MKRNMSNIDRSIRCNTGRIVRLFVFWRHCDWCIRHHPRCARCSVPCHFYRRFLPTLCAFQD